MICIEFRLFIGIIDALFNTEVVPYNDNSLKRGPTAMTSHSNALDFLLQRLPTAAITLLNSGAAGGGNENGRHWN